jgi:hypothetical protein
MAPGAVVLALVPCSPVRSLFTRRGLLVLIAVGVVLRLWVMTSPLGTLSADEAYTGLQARAILDGRFPVVIDGMTYTAVFESYLFAPFVAVFGLHVVPLKWLSTLGWVTAAVLTGAATRRLATPSSGRLASALMWLAPGAMLVLTTRAYVGYSTGVAAVAATLWATVRLVDRGTTTRLSAAQSAAVGALGGVAIYCHPMFATVVLPMLAVAAWVNWRHLRRWWLPATGAAIAVNLPFLVWNAVNDWPSLDQPAEATESATTRLGRFGTGLVPRVLGLRTGDGTWVHGRVLGVALYAALIGVVIWGVVVALRRQRAAGAVLAAPLVLGWPAMATLSNLSFVADGRYGIIMFPLLITALAMGIGDVTSRWRESSTAITVVTLWVVLLIVPWMSREVGRDLGDPNAHVQRVIDTLEAEGIDRVLGTYWWVLPIDLISGGRILTGTVGHPDVVLLPRTQAEVLSAPDERVAFVFAPDAYTPELLYMPEEHYRIRRVAGAVVLIPQR